MPKTVTPHNFFFLNMAIVLYYAKRFPFGKLHFLRDWPIENVTLRFAVLFDVCTVVFCLLFLTAWDAVSLSSVASWLFLISELTVQINS